MLRRLIFIFAAVALLLSMSIPAFAVGADRLNAAPTEVAAIHGMQMPESIEHHSHHHGKAGGKVAYGASCCVMACTPAIIMPSSDVVVARRYTDRYTFSNTSLIASIFGDPPLRPPRSAAA